jgi:glycosyltransferase involved in cell wall biosynthesis
MGGILFIQPSFQPPGGGNGVAAWMLEALRGRQALGVFTWTPLDVEEMNLFYGTSVRNDEVVTHRLPRGITSIIDAIPSPLASLRYALLLRHACRLAGSYDLFVSVNNEADFGRRGIQYIHYPWYQRPRPAVDLRWIHRLPGLLPLYFWSLDRLAGVSMDRMKQNVTLTNSDWTGRAVQRLHGITSRTLYPPIPARFADVPWEARRDAFLCIGRFSPEKNLDRVIDIVAAVRQRVPGLMLCLAGTPGPRDYYSRIRERARQAGHWVTFEENLSREALLALMPHFKYGIHGMLDEHFGMAPAEMAAAGAIVFVPNGGGQVEVVDRDPRLVYDTVEGAVASIVAVMQDADMQRQIRARLQARAQLFSTERFMASFRSIVDQVLEQRDSQGAASASTIR